MVSRGEYTSSRPKLDIEVLGKKNAGIFTVADAEEIEVPDNDSEDADATRKQVVLTFREYPDEAYYLSRGDTITLIDLFGDDETKWRGHKLPLVKRPWTFKKKKGVSLRLAELDDWADIGVKIPTRKAQVPAARNNGRKGRKRATSRRR